MSLKTFLDSEKAIVKSPKASYMVTPDEALGNEIYEKKLLTISGLASFF